MTAGDHKHTCSDFHKMHTRQQTENKLSVGLHLHREGLYQEAKHSYEEALNTMPDHPEALHLLGIIAYQRAENTEAIRLITKAIANNPANPSYYNNLGLAFLALNQSQQAKKNFCKALQLDPDYADAYNNLGNALKSQGHLDAAIDNYRKALQLMHDFPEAHLNLGKSLSDSGQQVAAMSHYQQAIKLNPGYAEAYNNLGNVLRDQGCIDDAIEKYRVAISLKPDYVGALNNLGNALRFKGRFDEAIDQFEQALEIKPASAETFCNLGNCFKGILQLTAATEQYQKAIDLKPDFVEAHFNKAVVHLLSGQFKAGWDEYEWRLQRPAWKATRAYRNNLPRWYGQSLAGQRILVISEQGFGDTLQFVRYLPFLKAGGGSVTLKTPKQLIGLFRDFPGLDRVTEHLLTSSPGRGHDFYVPLLSLPKIFDTTLETIPGQVPYLFSDPIKAQYWQPQIEGPAFKVGVVWAGSPAHSNDHNRSITPAHFAGCAQIPGVKLYGLQKVKAAHQSPFPTAKSGIINLGDRFEDFSDTAGAIENLDLIISVDTAIAHLAGAMGKPVWLLLPLVPDWRWLLHREDSPWYPTIRIFRQVRYGDWQTVLQRVVSQLEELAASTAPSDL